MLKDDLISIILRFAQLALEILSLKTVEFIKFRLFLWAVYVISTSSFHESHQNEEIIVENVA